MKTCKKCCIEKPKDEFYFYKTKNFTDGLCKICRNQSNKNWRRKNLKGIKLYQRENLIANGFNVCHVCEIVKPLNAFVKSNHVNTGYHNTCKSCKSISDKNTKLKSNYGINLDDYNLLLLNQGNMCKICKVSFEADLEPCVDHCHTTGHIRGLLCQSCNRGIGLLKDNIQVLYSAIRYLKNASPINK